VLHEEYVAFTHGPLVYATGLIDGFKASESVRLPEGPLENWLRHEAASASLTVELGYRPPLVFTPYFATGGRVDGAWRLAWLPLAPAT
jgi:hypothetical protein